VSERGGGNVTHSVHSHSLYLIASSFPLVLYAGTNAHPRARTHTLTAQTTHKLLHARARARTHTHTHLAHEAGDDAVEGAPLEAEALLARAAV
jgi:hypothetical protein